VGLRRNRGRQGCPSVPRRQGWVRSVGPDHVQQHQRRQHAHRIRLDPPVLSIIGFGHNEFINSVPVATFKANVQTLITKATATGSVILQTQVPNGTPRTPDQELCNQALYELADSNDVALLDIGIRWGAKASNDPLMYADNTHPSNQGLADMAAAYYGAIPLG
jgi:lysophospholipase L1-like esterase